MDIYSRFEATARRRADHPAVIYLGSRFSYRRLNDLAGRFAAALDRLQVEAGQKVVLYIPNSIQWVAAWLGIMKSGTLAVPITPIYTPHDLRYIIEDSGAETILCADTNFGYVQKISAATPLKRIIVTRMDDLLPTYKRLFGWAFDVVPRGKVQFGPRTWSLKRLLRQLPDRSEKEGLWTGHDRVTAEILYTGGTTKFPKGVPIGHDLFLAAADEQIRISEALIAPEENVIMANAPLFHVLGQTCGLATLLVGGTLIVQPRINLDATFDAIQHFRARTMIGVPALYRLILEHRRRDQYDLSSVDYWFSAGDVLPTEVGHRWQETFGKPIRQGYGATETCGGVAMAPAAGDSPLESVGRIVASKRVRIVDPASLAPVKRGSPGELLVSSPFMVSGYINKPEETAHAFIELDGRKWYRTGDIMSMDDQGNLYFVDRSVDVIKHKGYRVSASEIEAVLQEHPAVIGACVVGVPDEAVGERIKAYVVLKQDIKGITGYDLIKWCRRTLVAYKVPQYIEFRDMLPKSKVGKLLRREVRDQERRRKET
jgi:long-chain acyl-CoA synthetase